MAEPINIQDMIEGRLDIKSLGEAANGDENTQVVTRLGETYPSAKKAIKTMFENGGLPAKPFPTKAIMTTEGVSLPDGSYAIVTDEQGVNASNNGLYVKTAGTWVKAAYDPLAQAKDYADAATLKTIATYASESLTEKNKFISTNNAGYDTTGYIPVHEGQIVDVRLNVTGSVNACAFFSLNKKALTPTVQPTYSGVTSLRLTVPKGVCFIKVATINSSKSEYNLDDFYLKIKQSTNINLNNVIAFDYSDFLSKSSIGAADRTYENHNYIIMQVKGGQVIEYKNAVVVPAAKSFCVYDANYEVLSESNAPSSVVTLPSNAAYVVISSASAENAISSPEIRRGFYVKRTSLDAFTVADMRTSLTNTQAEMTAIGQAIDAIINETATVHDADYFTEAGGSGNYRKTPDVPTGKARYCFFIAQNYSIRVALTGKTASGEVIALSEPRGTLGLYSHVVKLPDTVVSVAVETLKETYSEYEEAFKPLLILGLSEKTTRKSAMSVLQTRPTPTGFPLVGKHATFSGRSDYDSTYRMPIVKGMTIDYSVQADAYAGAYYSTDDGVRRYLTEKSLKLVAKYDGYVQLSTKNSTHGTYVADYPVGYEVIYPDFDANESESVNIKQYIPSEYLSTPTLKAVRDVSYTDGTQRKAIQYLWHDKNNNFFISSSKRGHKEFIFKYDGADFYKLEPSAFSMNFDKYGNIICIYRTELESWAGYTETVRKNPIVLVKGNDYKAQVVDFGSALKPSAWIQNSGYLCTDDAIYFVEYTRPSVKTANTWRATYPVTDAANWDNVQSFPLSPDSQPSNQLKHMHHIDRDPYTGHIYTSHGDSDDSGSAIYVSKDNGLTFSKVLDGSQKYCRLLNFVYTEDFIYWASDSWGAMHWFVKAPRAADGALDGTNITDIMMFPAESEATYASIYMPKIQAIVFLGRADGAVDSIPIELWDLQTSTFVTIDTLKSTGEPQSVGFRCECFEYVPRDNEVICGFSKFSKYINHNGVLGNTNMESAKVNNLVLIIDRCGAEFTISYDTII